MIEVFHLKWIGAGLSKAENDLQAKAIIGGDVEAVEELASQGRYEKVAEVASSDWEEAFELTNTIDSYWGENERVSDLVGQCRSTSVGDVMLMNGVARVVASCGFEELKADAEGFRRFCEKKRKFGSSI